MGITGNYRTTIAILALAASSAVSADKKALQAANEKSKDLVGKPAPEFSLPDLDRKAFQLADGRGQVVVLAFWATWCPPCRSEMPTFAKLQKEMASQGVAITPIAVDGPAKARGFLKQKHIDLWSLVDESHTVTRPYGASFLPRTFVINREGVVAKTFVERVSEADLRAAIRAAQGSK